MSKHFVDIYTFSYSYIFTIFQSGSVVIHRFTLLPFRCVIRNTISIYSCWIPLELFGEICPVFSSNFLLTWAPLNLRQYLLIYKMISLTVLIFSVAHDTVLAPTILRSFFFTRAILRSSLR